MAIPLIICDDSLMSRKLVKRSLPENWQVDITMVSDGKQCLQAVEAGKGEMIFLDLTMPEMDGYQVLQQLKETKSKSIVIVISGDIQPEARERVMNLGALDFIKKPINHIKLKGVLNEYGLL